MEKCIIIDGGHPSGCNSDVKIYIKSDFKLSYRFTDNSYKPTIVVPPINVNFIFTYYIYGRPEKYVSSNINGVLTNCAIDEINNKAKIIFENHGLKPGRLMVEYRFITDDSDMPTGKSDTYKGGDTGIILTNDILDNLDNFK